MKTKRNKGIFAAVCVILCYILINTANVLAADTVLFNKGEKVSLNYPLIQDNGEYYIAIEDLKSINLSHDGSEDKEMYIFKQYGERYAYTLSITGNYFKGDNEIYENVTVLKEGIRYIKLQPLAEVFSDTYLETDSTIELWINNYLTQSFEVTVNLDVPAPEEGFAITLFSGLNDSTIDPYPFPSGGGGGHTSYRGTYTNIPDATDMTGTGKIYLKNMQTITKTIPYGESSVTVSFDVERTQYQDYYDTYIGYYVNNKYYWDGGYRGFDFLYNGNRNISFTTSCVEKKYINGTVTVPEHDEALSYTIVAEADRTLNYYDNGSYDVSRSHTFKTNGTLAENETTQNYSLAVLGDKDYYVYIVFSNGEYIRKSVEVENLTEDTKVDFNSLSVSNKVSGTIKLPEDFECSEPSTIMARVFLQSAAAPYYYLDEKTVHIDAETKSGDFTLTDEMGVENAIVYFYLWDTKGEVLEGIYDAGVYKNNEECVANVKYATTISPNSSNIILNAIKGKTVAVTQRVSGCDLYSGTSDVYLLLQKSVNASEADAQEVELYYTDRETISENETEKTETYTFVVPEGYSYYILKYNHFYSNSNIYVTENENLTEDIMKAKVYSVDNTSVNVSYSGYEPDIPFEVMNFAFDKETGLRIELQNKYDKIYSNNVRCYIAFYDSNEKLSKVTVENTSIGGRSYVPLDLTLTESDYNAAEKIRLLIFDEKLRPLATETLVK